MISNSTGHFGVAEIKGLVTAKLVVSKIVREEYVEFCPDIIVSHLMQKLHGFSSSAIS